MLDQMSCSSPKGRVPICSEHSATTTEPSAGPWRSERMCEPIWSKRSMGTKRTLSLVNGWETIRYELLNTRICDMGLQIEGSRVEPFIRRLYRELELRR